MRIQQIAFGLTLICAALLSACVPSAVPKFSYKPVECMQPQVFVTPHYPVWQGKLVVNAFSADKNASGVGDTLARAYYQELLRTGYFSQVSVVEVNAQDQKGAAPPYAGDSSLVLSGKVLYLLAGSGGTPSKLCVEVKVIDPAQQLLLWYVRQEASSKPGPDVDLFWSTIPGERALPYQALTEAIAKQFATLVTAPNIEQDPSQASSPFINPIRSGSRGL